MVEIAESQGTSPKSPKRFVWHDIAMISFPRWYMNTATFSSMPKESSQQLGVQLIFWKVGLAARIMLNGKSLVHSVSYARASVMPNGDLSI